MSITASRIDPADLVDRTFPEKVFAYDDVTTMLYGLVVGMAQSPLDQDELKFVTETDLKALPSLVTVLAWDDSWLTQVGIDVSRVVHGEQRITLHKPVPARGRVASRMRIVSVFDKGVGRGAVLFVETVLRDLQDGAPLATMLSTVFARGDGGFGGVHGSPPPLRLVPERAPDISIACQTMPNQALFYRLLGDRNPLHSDPVFARNVGYERPILHGLCTYGIAVRALLKGVANSDPAAISHVEARFTAPVFPGETIVTDIWHEPKAAAFRARSLPRDVTVLDRGRVTLR